MKRQFRIECNVTQDDEELSARVVTMEQRNLAGQMFLSSIKLGDDSAHGKTDSPIQSALISALRLCFPTGR